MRVCGVVSTRLPLGEFRLPGDLEQRPGDAYLLTRELEA